MCTIQNKHITLHTNKTWTMAFVATHAIHIYYAHLALAGFEHSLCCGSLKNTYISNEKHFCDGIT